MAALQLAPVVVGTAAYLLLLACGESDKFAILVGCGVSASVTAVLLLAHHILWLPL